MKDLWVEKYRPSSIETYVFRDDNQRRQVAGWKEDGALPHLLFSGAPGTGKTTLAKVLLQELDVDSMDILEINASNENSVDTIRSKITNFSSTMPFGDMKYVLLDEADYISPNGQAALRGVMETYHASARFILTCNYPNRVIPALHSRCQGFHIEKVDKTEFTARIATVLVAENVELDIETLDTYVRSTYPDLRKCLNLCQMNSTDGKLSNVKGDEGNTSDWRVDAVNLFKAGKITDARKLMCATVRPEEMEDVFRWMYDNLELFSSTPEGQDSAIMAIRTGLVNHSFVADPEINLSATMVELSQING